MLSATDCKASQDLVPVRKLLPAAQVQVLALEQVQVLALLLELALGQSHINWVLDLAP